VPEPPLPAQVVTWLPEGRWVTDPDELAPDADDHGGGGDDASAAHGRPGGSERGRPWLGRRRAGRGRRESGRSRPARELEPGQVHLPLGGPEPGRARSGRDQPEPGQRGPRRRLEPGQPRSPDGWRQSGQRDPGRGLEPGQPGSPDGWVQSGQRHSGPGRLEPGLPRTAPGLEPDRRRSVSAGWEDRRSETAERARRRAQRRVRLARVGARLAGWPRRVVIGILLVVAAVLALRPEGAQPPAAAAGPTEHVVVAARDLAAGTELAAADLRIVSMPVGIVPSGSSPRMAGLIGRIAAGAIRRGETLTDARVVGPGLAVGLGPGESAAVPVRIADPDAAALVRIGDRVDVLGTPVAPDGTQATAGETVTVATAVRVLAVLRSRDPSDGVVLVVGTGEAAARTLAGAAARHRLTVNVRSP
jgi:pilus assembly protein CpaB